MSIATMSADDAPTHTVLLGISTPISGLALPGSGTDSVLAVVTVQHGTLLGDTAPGGTLRGSGSGLIWISGSVDQVNAKLATLTYVGATVGTDTVTVTSVGAGSQVTTAARLPLTVASLVDPSKLTNETITIDNGTLTLDTRVVDGPSLALVALTSSPSMPTSILINTTLGAHTDLSIENRSSAAGPRLAVAGRVELDGTTRFAGNGSTVSLAQGATLFNEGSMEIEAGAALFTGTGTLINDGSIAIDGSTGAAPVRIDPAVDGSGTVTLESGASLWLSAGYAVGGTITLGAGANTLHLASPGSFAGAIAGFDHLDTLVLDGTTATNAIYTASADSGTGTLSLFDGPRLVGNIRLVAPEPGTVFQLGTDATGNATIQAAQALSPAMPANLDVFRFFDAANGTQFLTQNAAERDLIIASRPDLRFEGIDFKAVAPGQPDANNVNVFRFFDTNNGTHFMTSSLAERDTLLASRPDLVFEPGSTVVEHASAQPGDVAVYRFFDQHTGAHFFTADAGERASLVATRPDMTAEGIAFYAPTA